MKPASFRYHRATALDEAAGLMATLDNARLLSGGQSLMPMMNMRYVMVDHLVDLNPVRALAGIGLDRSGPAGGRVRIGAMTRQRDLMASEALRGACPIIAQALAHVGHLQTRNRGTIGGSLCHLDPAAELPGLMALLDATLTVEGARGRRHIPMAEFPLGYMAPAVEPDEILARIEFETWPAGHGWDFREFAQRHGDFAVVGTGCLLHVRDGRIGRAAVVLIGVDEAPVRLSDVEEMLAGEAPSEALFRAAGEAAARRPMMGDALVGEEYRQHLAGVLLRRSLAAAAARAKETGDG